MNRVRHALATAFAGITLLPGLACGAEPAVPPGPSVEIRGQRVIVEIARTRAEQSRGLGQRDSLDWGRGMLFLYDEAGFYGFWMKDMRFDIDIVWIRDDRIVDIAHRAKHSPEGPGLTHRPREVADRVLEVPAGFAAAHGWRKHDVAKFDLSAPGSDPGHP